MSERQSTDDADNKYYVQTWTAKVNQIVFIYRSLILPFIACDFKMQERDLVI
jgi:hypothetical protein